MERSPPSAVLITGVYGSGKSSVAEELATMLEGAGVRYAALDLDWLGWFDAGWDDDDAEFELTLRNLEAVIRNYREAGIERFVLALSVESEAALDAIGARIGMPLRVARLTVPIEEIERRLEGAPTSGRAVDLRWARVWAEEGRGVGFEDVVVDNDRPLEQAAGEILAELGWIPPAGER